MVLTLFSVEVESSGGFRGELLEKIQKSTHKIVHTIEVKGGLRITGQLFKFVAEFKS